jgi:hypothetical protein
MERNYLNSPKHREVNGGNRIGAITKLLNMLHRQECRLIRDISQKKMGIIWPCSQMKLDQLIHSKRNM